MGHLLPFSCSVRTCGLGGTIVPSNWDWHWCQVKGSKGTGNSALCSPAQHTICKALLVCLFVSCGCTSAGSAAMLLLVAA